MKSKMLSLLGVCFLMACALAAQSEAKAGSDQNVAAEARSDEAKQADEPQAAPSDLGLFAPKAEVRSCYSQCLATEIPIYCGGLSGAELQQCSSGVAEGCRCGCGLYCP